MNCGKGLLVSCVLATWFMAGYAQTPAPGVPDTSSSNPTQSANDIGPERWNLYYQATSIGDYHGTFTAHGRRSFCRSPGVPGRWGLDFLIGDGRLNYAPEYVWESYYSACLVPGFYATFDLQRDVNPAYNHDRGPVTIYSVRLHMALALKPRQRC